MVSLEVMISSLLNSLGLSSQLVYTTTKLKDDLSPYYDVEKEQQYLESLRSESLDFLKQSLKD